MSVSNFICYDMTQHGYQAYYVSDTSVLHGHIGTGHVLYKSSNGHVVYRDIDTLTLNFDGWCGCWNGGIPGNYSCIMGNNGALPTLNNGIPLSSCCPVTLSYFKTIGSNVQWYFQPTDPIASFLANAVPTMWGGGLATIFLFRGGASDRNWYLQFCCRFQESGYGSAFYYEICDSWKRSDDNPKGAYTRETTVIHNDSGRDWADAYPTGWGPVQSTIANVVLS
jgi:hypothetical protein